jgi:hypothetical protein
MPIDLSRDEDDQLLPAGIYKLRTTVLPGGFGDDDVLKLAKRGTLAYVNVKNTVAEGPFAGREIWDTLIVEAVCAADDPEQAARDQKTVKIGRGRARRIIASARAVNPEADPETLKQALTINSWGDLDRLTYWAEVGIEPAKNGFEAKNKIEHVVTPADANWPGSPSQPKLPTRPVTKPANDDMSDEIPF